MEHVYKIVEMETLPILKIRIVQHVMNLVVYAMELKIPSVMLVMMVGTSIMMVAMNVKTNAASAQEQLILNVKHVKKATSYL